MKLIYTKTTGMSEAEWQQLRKSYTLKGMTGGSDAGTLIGWNKWKSPISMYYQALGLADMSHVMNMEMLMGKLQEDNIAESWQYYSDNDEEFMRNAMTKTKVRRYVKVRAIVENPLYPTLFANIDGKITLHPTKGKKRGILEIKKINGISVDSYVGGLPPQYIAQIQHYMLVMGLDYGELCMRVDGRMLSVTTIEKNVELQMAILDASIEFNRRVMAARAEIMAANTDDKDIILGIAAMYEPDADNTDDFNAFISEKHKARESENIMTGSDSHRELAEQYVKYNKLQSSVESHKQLYQNKIKQIMEKENVSKVILSNGTITWRKQFIVKLNKK